MNVFAFLLLALVTAPAHALPALNCARDMEHVTVNDAEAGVPFEVTGTISGFRSSQTNLPCQLLLRDDSGTTVLNNHLVKAPDDLRPNDLVIASGKFCALGLGIYADLYKLTVLRHQSPDTAQPVPIAELVGGKCDGQLVTTRGTVSGAFPDEIDSVWLYLILADGPHAIYAPIMPLQLGITNADSLLGASVELTGWCCNSALTGARKYLGRVFNSAPDGCRILRQPPYDPFAVPPLDDCRQRTPAEINGLTPRRIFGTVLAAWRRNNILLKSPGGRLSCVRLVKPELPPFGATVEVVGTPETDLYHINLSAARWRAVPETTSLSPPPPDDIEVRNILKPRDGQPNYNALLHGRPVRIRGIVRVLPQPNDPDGLLYVESQGMLIAADFSALPNALSPLEPGSTVSLSGTCVFESDNWRPNAIFPSIHKAIIVGRTASDLRVLTKPPWWTPMRFFVVIAALTVCLAGIAFWNRFLKRRIEQRNRALLDEQIAHVTSDLKTMERTRLAIELHDSLSQNLTGIALELQTAQETLPDGDNEAARHLKIADRSLKSCREELRNCLRDLRSEALESPVVNDAIRMTLAPLVAGTDVSIRFNVDRDLMSDNTMHALLRIIRELALNAVRHGHAKTIRIAGAIENDKLLFSVSDDGCGFDPENRPGLQDGHFGLQGIKERVNAFEGTMDIASAIGKGTKVTIALRKPERNMSCER